MIPSSHRSETYGRRTVCCCVAVDAVGVAVCCCGADRLRASFNFRPWLGIVAERYLAVHTVLRCTVLFHIHTSCTAILAHVPPQAHASTVYRRLRAGIPASQPPSPAHPQLSSPTLLLQPEHPLWCQLGVKLLRTHFSTFCPCKPLGMPNLRHPYYYH